MRFAKVPLSGNPDRVCDLIAAGIADEYLKRDPETRIVCQVSGGKGAVFVTGEVLSRADFDVARWVQRLLGKHGIYEQTESFIALESVASENVGRFRSSCFEPFMAVGYATRETESGLPKPMDVARAIARLLESRRRQDQEWFWLGTAGYVSVMAEGEALSGVNIEIEHGSMELTTAKEKIQALIAAEIGLELKLSLNPMGVAERQGFGGRIGRSGSVLFPYGYNLPSMPNPAGRDWHSAEVYGQWMARDLAKWALDSGAKASMSELLFCPGDVVPSRVLVRDERGRVLINGPEEAKKSFERIQASRKAGMMEEIVADMVFNPGHSAWERQDSALSTSPGW